MTENELLVVLQHARTLVLQSGVVQESEKKMIETTNPHLSYYFLSGIHYAQYFITWKLPEEEAISVRGQGDLLSLEGAEVVRLPKKAKN